MSNIAFTIVAKNYFASARTLAQSMRKSNPDCRFYIVLADEICDEIAEIKDDSFELLTVEQISNLYYREMAFKYDVTEFATAIKPFCIEFFQNKEGIENVLYIDPDIYVYESFAGIFSLLKEYSAVVTPHLLTCEEAGSDIEAGLLFSGVYNLGFFGVSNSLQGRAIIDWWKSRLENGAYIDRANSLYTDQKWMNLVTSEFDKVFVLRDYACNVAWWNFRERNISDHNGKPFVVQEGLEKPVIFFHFSGYKAGNQKTISKSESYERLDNKSQILHIFEGYEKCLFNNGYRQFSKLPYAFLTYENGIIITRMQRRFYRIIIEAPEKKEKYADPFSVKNGSYYALLKRNKLLVHSRDTRVASVNKSSLSGFSRKEKMIQRALGILKCMIGIQKYEILTRYLSHALEAENQVFLIHKH